MQPPYVLLIYSAPGAGANDTWMNFLPIGLTYIQAMLKSRGFPCKLANLSGMPKKKISEYIQTIKPDLVGVSMFTFNRKRSRELIKVIRKSCPGAFLLAGGPHPTHLAEEVFRDCPELDAIVCGEGETPMLEIVKHMALGEDWRESPSLILPNGTRTAMAEPIGDLDTIGLPAEYFEADFFDDYSHLGYLSTSRGCPASCAFCNTPEFWGRNVRFRSPLSVMREMQTLWGKYGLTCFNFRDDAFTTNKSRVLALCETIKSSGIYPLWSCQSRINLIDEERLVALVRAGCEFIQFGVEHGSERMLKKLGKEADMEQIYRVLSIVRKVGVNLGIYLITGIPGETMEDVKMSENLIKRALPHDVQISPLAVYPGTRLYYELRASGKLPPDFYRKARDIEVFARKDENIIIKAVDETTEPGRVKQFKVAGSVSIGAQRSYVDAHTAEALERLSQTAERTRIRARYTMDDFRRQKRFLGWCATTNILCGEAAEDAGDAQEAYNQYSEIIKREPNNPWGWLKRGLLNIRQKNHSAASSDLLEVLRITPNNYEAVAALRYV